MHPTNCLNCATILTADDNFCPTCGQKTDTHHITIKHIFHEFFHSFTHADKGFLGMIADLAIRPGIVATEYIAGKRKKYFNPFTFFLLCIGLVVFSSHTFNAIGEPQKANPAIVAKLPTEKAKRQYIALITRTNNATEFMSKNLNLLTMLALPYYTFFFWIFFRRRGYNYAEIMVAYMMFSSFTGLLTAATVIPLLSRLKTDPNLMYVTGAIFILVFIYISWALYQFFKFKKPLSFLLLFMVSIMSAILFFLLVFSAMYYYVFRDNTWMMLQLTWKQLFSS
jgi:hypothetical protein